MAKQRAPLEFSSIAGGIITEASALTFPDNASLDESNFELSKDGTRTRRFGFELEAGGEQYATGNLYSEVNPDSVNSFLWSNVGGNGGIELTVVQVGEGIHFYRSNVGALSSGKVDRPLSIEGAGTNLFSFASVDGNLVVVSGLQTIMTITPILGTSGELSDFDVTESRLTIRDLFGIPVQYDRSAETGEPEDDYIDITLPEYITKRPLLEGLPNSSLLDDTVEVASNLTEVWTTLTSNPDNFFGTISWTLYGARAGFSPASVFGNNIVSIATVDKEVNSGAGVGQGVNPAYSSVVFSTVPTFNVMEVTDLSTAAVHTFTKTLTGTTFHSPYITAWKTAVPAPFQLEFDVVLNTVVSTLYNYNLRNQTFGVNRLTKTGTSAVDTIGSFYGLDNKMPSMSDTVLSALYPNIEATNKTADRFHAEDLLENPVGSAPSPKGYFIIDALNRSDSRTERWQEAGDDQGYYAEVVDITDVHPDSTPGGPRAVAEYSGRLWYGGFSEEGTRTDDGGIRLESYLLYSQLANSKDVLTRCYQKGDPTSPESPELLDTDGGFLSLDGAYGISSLVPVGNSLLVFGSNGVWAVSGFDGNYFSPTSPRVQLVTSKGSISPRAIVVIDSVVMYWSRDGIYVIAKGELGAYKVESLTERTIQTLYTELPLEVRAKAFGEYDPFTSKVSWFIYNTTSREEQTKVLSLLTTTGAFTLHELSDGNEARTLIGPAEVSPYSLGSAVVDVVVGSEQVVVGTEQVAVEIASGVARTLSVKGVYLERDGNGYTLLSFGEFSNEEFKDWGEVDAPAYIVTGYVSGGDFQRYKQVPYVTMHFDRTEDGFYADEAGDLYPLHASSCKLQAQWDWANSVNSGRWGREVQAYRYTRLYMPADVDDLYDTGFSTITTKNKIRGKGRVLSLKLSTEEGKDCRILGWSALMGVNNNV